MRDSYFDVTAKDAVDVVLSDPKKEKDAREEDAEFIRRLRRNEPVRFGARDWVQQGRFDRAAKRAQEQQQRQEKEEKRQRVSSEIHGQQAIISQIVRLTRPAGSLLKRSYIWNKAGYTVISCGRVGRGVNARFPTFRLDGYGPTDRPTD